MTYRLFRGIPASFYALNIRPLATQKFARVTISIQVYRLLFALVKGNAAARQASDVSPFAKLYCLRL